MVETHYKFHVHYIVDDFKIILVEEDDKFHIYDILDKFTYVLWKEITNSYNPFLFSNHDPFEGEQEHH